MKLYLLRLIVLLTTFALGWGAAGAGRYLPGGEARRIESANQKPFTLVVRKRTDSARPSSACY